jgi:hypothetical protein
MYYNIYYLVWLRLKPVKLSKEVYEYCIDVVLRLDVTEVPTKEEICNMVINPQTIEQADTDDE